MADDATQPTGKNRRQSHVKVKSGCITCKIRRVKCDETKPSCLRCSSTRRKCDGYQGKEPLKFLNITTGLEHVRSDGRVLNPRSSTKHSSKAALSKMIGSPQNPLLDFLGTTLEHRSLEFFRVGAAPALSGFLDTEFWTIILPRVASSEPPVQHAMVALGSFYEHCRDNEKYPNVMQQRYALIQYNKAIRALKRCKVEDPKTQEVTLLTCLLFVCLEMLAGNAELALNHLYNGINILDKSRKAKGNASSLESRKSAGPGKFHLNPRPEEDVLGEMFSRLSIQASLCGRRMPDLYPSGDRTIVEDEQSAQLPFASMLEARLSLKKLLIRCLQPNEFFHVKYDPSFGPSEALKSERESLFHQLHHWNSRLALHMIKYLPDLSLGDVQSSRVLRMLSIIAMIWNKTTHSVDESAHDAHLEAYTTIVSLAASFVKESTPSSPATNAPMSPSAPSISLPSPLQSARSPPPAFAFEMGIIAALYFTAIKCRSPSVRRKAISLLSEVVPQREGLWDARVRAKISQRIVEVEEAELSSEDEWPAEAMRIHGVSITPHYSPAERRQEVQFSWRNGQDGEWMSWLENIEY